MTRSTKCGSCPTRAHHAVGMDSARRQGVVLLHLQR